MGCYPSPSMSEDQFGERREGRWTPCSRGMSSLNTKLSPALTQWEIHLSTSSSSSSRCPGDSFCYCCFEAKGYSLILYRVAVVEAVSFQSQPLSYTLLMNPSGLFKVRQESGELSLTHPVDYESEHHLYHLLLKAMEVESALSSVTEVCGSLCFLPTVSAIFVTSLAGPVTHRDSLENSWRCSGGRRPYGAGRRLGSDLGSDLGSAKYFLLFLFGFASHLLGSGGDNILLCVNNILLCVTGVAWEKV